MLGRRFLHSVVMILGFHLSFAGYSSAQDRPQTTKIPQLPLTTITTPVEPAVSSPFFSKFLTNNLAKSILSEQEANDSDLTNLRAFSDWFGNPVASINESSEVTVLAEQRTDPIYRGNFTSLLFSDSLDSSNNSLLISNGSDFIQKDVSGRYKIQQEMSKSLLSSKAQFDMADLNGSNFQPYTARDWKAGELLKLSLPMAESMFFFGQFDSNADGFAYRKLTAIAKTGLGVKWSPLTQTELQLSGGPMVTYTDLSDATRIDQKSRLAFEFTAKIPLFLNLNLQYTGSAMKSYVATLSNQLNQDIRIAMPLGNGNEFHVGAKKQIDYIPTQSQTEQTQVYLGFQIKR